MKTAASIQMAEPQRTHGSGPRAYSLCSLCSLWLTPAVSHRFGVKEGMATKNTKITNKPATGLFSLCSLCSLWLNIPVSQNFEMAARRLEPRESGRQLEQQRDQLPGGEPQQQQPDEPEQQHRIPFRPAPSSTPAPSGVATDPAAILSTAGVLPRQIRNRKLPGASSLAEPVEASGRFPVAN